MFSVGGEGWEGVPVGGWSGKLSASIQYLDRLLVI